MRPEIYVYRVQTNHRLWRVRRTWQAEWEPCPWCPRAYTERGVRRRAARWQRRGFDWQLANCRRRVWWRAHVTQRRDPYYAAIRRKVAA